MNRYATTKDLTAKQHPGGGGMSYYRTFLFCKHKGSTTGATYRKGLGFVLCPACTKWKA
ncbi:MAG: hypothetical protein ACRC1H_09095 [Caldilineaceae bacterium]